jgi:transposase-like protein
MTPCKPHCDYTKAINPRRAVWLCAGCGRDFSMEYLFWFEATQEDEE